MKKLTLFTALAISLTVSLGLSAAAEKNTPQSLAIQSAPNSSLVVAELFTSQGCSSCPPAEQLFSTLAEEEDVLTLEWHVDVWDDLVHGGSRWKDPYSSKSFTDRQRAYNISIRGQTGIYTPQAVVNGQFEGVGSRPAEVSDMLENVSRLTVGVNIKNDNVSVAASAQSADILFLRLLKQHETDIKGGENKGRKLAGKNIVLEATVLGKTGAETKNLKLPAIGEEETCAVLIQKLDGELSPILGAAKCA